MKIEGTYRVAAPRGLVWQKLMDPEVLARSLPGCEKLARDLDGSYRTEMKVGIAAVKGPYHGRVVILDPQPPEQFRMKVEGQGAGGFLKGEDTLGLGEDAGGTVVTYSGDAQVGGLIASVGQRLVLAATRQIIHQFFEAFAKQLASGPSPTAA